MTLVSERIGQYFHDEHRLEYTEYGWGDRWVVLLPGQLMPRWMNERLARAIAGSGAHVVTLDLLGHGRSDRPEDPMLYSVTAFAEQVMALLDHLGADKAVIGGTSLGANVALEAAVLAPERVCGLIAEMPVLHNAVEPGIWAMTPVLFVARTAPLAVTGVRLASRSVPRRLMPFWARIALDSLDQDAGPLAAAVHGILFGRMAPSAAQRRAIAAPALVIGHRRDPLHPAADAELLVEELIDSRFVEASGLLEWRRRPERLNTAAIDFVAVCYGGSEPRRRIGG